MQVGAYQIDILSQGYPGKTFRHGGLGWSTVVLLRGHGHVALLDTGAFGLRRRLTIALSELGLAPADVTDVIFSHLHYDHVQNWPMFAGARMVTGAEELAWARSAPVGDLLLPEFEIAELAKHPRLETVGEGDEVLPGITAYLAPGHTPGHLIFLVKGEESDLLLVQDAAKYRAELVTRRTDMTFDPAVSTASIEKIWGFWRQKPGTVVLPGHDLPMVLEDGVPVRMGRQEAGIIALFGGSVDEHTDFPLAEA